MPTRRSALGNVAVCVPRASPVPPPALGPVSRPHLRTVRKPAPLHRWRKRVWRRGLLLRGRCRRVFQARRVLFGFRFFRGRWLNCSARISRSVAFRSAKELLRGRWLNCSARTFVETGVGRLRIDVQAGTRFVHRKRSTFAPVRSGHKFMSRFRLGAVGPSVGCRGMVRAVVPRAGLGGKSGVGRRSLSRTGFLLADIRFLIASLRPGAVQRLSLQPKRVPSRRQPALWQRLNLFRRRRGPFGNRSKLPGGAWKPRRYRGTVVHGSARRATREPDRVMRHRVDKVSVKPPHSA